MKGKAHCLQLFSYLWIGCELDKSFLFKLPWSKIKMCQEPTFILNSNVTNAVAPWPFQKVAAICSQKNPAWGTETQYIQCWVTLNASSVAISRFPLLCCPSLQKPRRRRRKRRKRRRKRKRWKWWVHTLKLKCLLAPQMWQVCHENWHPVISSSCHLCYEQSTDTHCCRHWLAPLLCVCTIKSKRCY